MKKIFGIVLLALVCLISAAYAVEYPQFKSAVSTTGITANFDTIYSKADQLKMIHNVVEHNAKGIVWNYKDTGNWAIVKDDGTVVIASPSAFSLNIKKVLVNDLVRAKDLIRSTGGSASVAPLIYYVDDPYLYRVITYDFKSNFNLKLYIPECILHKALLTITGSDYAQTNTWSGAIETPGQHYFIDDKEISGCDAVYCTYMGLTPGGGISCAPGPCDTSYNHIQVNVNPVDITGKIAPGIHTVSASAIDNQHTMIIEAVTSPSKDEMLLYSDDYRTMINETRSSPMSELYALIQPNTEAFNTTSKTLMTNTTG